MAFTKKASDYISNVRGLLDDDQFDAALILQAVNWFIYEVFNNTHTRLMETSGTLIGTINSPLVPLPLDMLSFIGIYQVTPQVIKVPDPMNYKSFMQNYANFATAVSARPTVWTMYGNKMRWSQPLNSAATFQCDYLRLPLPLLIDNSNTCEIPDNYEELVTKGALARIMEINEDYAEASQERNNFAPLLTTFIRNEARGGGKTSPTVIRARSQNRSVNPYNEVG